MGARTADDILNRVSKKTAPTPAPEPVRVERVAAPPRPTRKERLEEQGLTYTGYYINAQAREQLRKLSYDQRREKQDLFREAMNLLFEKYDMDVVTYAPENEES